MKQVYSTFFLVFLFSSAVYSQIEWLDTLKPLVVEDANHAITLRASMQKNHVNSMSFAMSDKEHHVTKVAYSNQESFDKIDPDTRYQAGSISKPLAALGVMVLVKKYHLDLDASINDYLKSWQIQSEEFDQSKVTIRNLLSHTAGITVHGFMGYRKLKKVPEITEILNGKGNSGQVSMFNDPDEQWKYSGGGYEILHLLIEDVSGEDFASFMQREVLEPIGMQKSTFDLLLEETCADCAQAFNREGEAYKPNWYLYPEAAAAGLWTTAEDLMIFLQYLVKVYNGKEGIISTLDLMEMFVPVQNNYGLGFFITEKNNETYVGHSGKNIGFSNDMKINLNTGTGYVCMTDSDGAFSMIEDIKRSIPVEGNWTDQPQVVAKRISKSIEEMTSFEGEYVFKRKKKVNFKAALVVENSELILINKNAGLRQKLIPIGDTSFLVQETGEEVEITMENGEMRMVFNGRFQFVKK